MANTVENYHFHILCSACEHVERHANFHRSLSSSLSPSLSQRTRIAYMFVCVRAYYIEQDNIQAKSKLYAALFQRDKISLCSRIQIIKMRKNFVGGAAAGRVFSSLVHGRNIQLSSVRFARSENVRTKSHNRVV